MKQQRRKSYVQPPMVESINMNSIDELTSKIEALTKTIEETAKREELLDELIALKQQSEDIQARYSQKLSLFNS